MKLTIGLLTYNDHKYLPYFWESLSKQSIISECEIFCIDNNESNSTKDIIAATQTKFPNKIKFIQSKTNLGFAKAHNFMMNAASSRYYLCLNNDIVMDEFCIERLIDSISKMENTASVQPKLLYWDFERNRKTATIDSLGLGKTKHHSFYELCSGGNDREITSPMKIFGCTGAFVIYDLDKLKNIAMVHDDKLSEIFLGSINIDEYEIVDKAYIEYFDDSFFMYKEDVDLAWRLNRKGYFAYLVPNAVAWHDRTAKQLDSNYFIHLISRKVGHSDLNRKLSHRNHIKMLVKNLKVRDVGILSSISTTIYEVSKLVYIVIFDRKILL